MGQHVVYPPGTILTLFEPGTGTLHMEVPLGRCNDSIPMSHVRCSICGRRSTKRRVVNLGCERCGVPFHERCFLRLVATETERHTLLATEQPFIFLCQQCRS